MRDIITIVLWVLALWYATIPLFWFMIHPFAHHWRTWKRSPFIVLLPAWLAMVAVAGWLTWPYVTSYLYLSYIAWLLGGTMILGALMIYRAAKQHFSGVAVSGRAEIETKHEQPLIQIGIHGKVRHPLYVAHLLNLSAVALITASLAVYLLLAVALPAGALMIWLEERELEARFGESFREYKRRVPAMIPHLGEKSADREVRG